MNNNKEYNVPHFFVDESKTKDHEIMLDYFLAWTLRCAQESNQMEGLRIAGRKIIAYLIEDHNFDNYFVEKVETRKQWKHIDLIAEITLHLKKDKTKKRRIAILFENKMYTHLREGQLEKYKTEFDAFYNTDEKSNPRFELHYIVLTCHYKPNQIEPDKIEAEKNGFRFLRFDEIKKSAGITDNERTGNFMFDEFWFEYF